MKPSVLMVEPDYYKVEYAINSFMVDSSGRLQSVNQAWAHAQWTDLAHLFKSVGVRVERLKGSPGLPDMVFSANNALLFKNPRTGRNSALMSRMHSAFRQPEVKLFEEWYRDHGYSVEHLQTPNVTFEGCGDALLQKRSSGRPPLLWGGYGHRTDKKVYDEIAERFGFEVVTLNLVHKDFYHLDTCFAVLNEDVIALQKSAFSEGDLAKIKAHTHDVIEVDRDEAFNNFAANCFSPNGRDVILQSGSPHLVRALTARGFLVHETQTTEFMKGGGSVFCLKMSLLS